MMAHNLAASNFPDAISDGEADESWLEAMERAKPIYSRKRVNAAGRLLVQGTDSFEEMAQAYEVISNWRACHSFPLNTFQTGIRRKARAIDPDAIVAQRTKRLSSIEHKLRRFPTMTLSQMQDIGGCRAVLKTTADVSALHQSYEDSQMKHPLAQCDNYIIAPKRSGYRGIHLIYKYFSDKKATYNGLKIEVQIRSQLQHAWATSVETVGTFLRQALKSSMGEEDWLRFFALMGTAFAYREETQLVPNTPQNYRELVIELREYVKKLDVQNRLLTYGAALNVLQNIEMKRSHYFLLVLKPTENQVQVIGFEAKEIRQAEKEYLKAETTVKDIPGGDAVLVSVDSLAALRRAYPNYFLGSGPIKFASYVEQ